MEEITLNYNKNNPIYEFLSSLCEFVVLNILFIICCLPIFTIGAAITALYQITMKEARKEHGYVVGNYLKYFKENFICSTKIWLLYLFCGLILLFNMGFWNALETIFGSVVFGIMIAASLILSILIIYSFPLLARFKNTTSQTIKNSLFIAFHHYKCTLALIFIYLAVIGTLLIVPKSKVFMLLLGFSFIAYCNSLLLVNVLKKYEAFEKPLRNH